MSQTHGRFLGGQGTQVGWELAETMAKCSAQTHFSRGSHSPQAQEEAGRPEHPPTSWAVGLRNPRAGMKARLRMSPPAELTLRAPGTHPVREVGGEGTAPSLEEFRPHW